MYELLVTYCYNATRIVITVLGPMYRLLQRFSALIHRISHSFELLMKPISCFKLIKMEQEFISFVLLLHTPK